MQLLSWTESSKSPPSFTTRTMTSETTLHTQNHLFTRSVFNHGASSALPSVRFKEHLNNNPPKEVLSSEEYEELRSLCRQSQKAERAEQAQEEEEERPPGEEEPATPEGTDSVSDDHNTANIC